MPENEFTLPLVWVGLDETPIHFANQFASQFIGSEFVLSIGQVAPPLIVGNTPEEVQNAMKVVRFASVKPVARVGLTPERMRELVKLLQSNLESWEKTRAGGAS